MHARAVEKTPMKLFSNFTRSFLIPYSNLPCYLLPLEASHDYDKIEAFPRLNGSKKVVLYYETVISLGNLISPSMINFMMTSPFLAFSYHRPQGCGPDKSAFSRWYSYLLSHRYMQGHLSVDVGTKMAIVRNAQNKRESLMSCPLRFF